MSVRLELSDLPPRIRAQAEAQIAARGQKKASAAPSIEKVWLTICGGKHCRNRRHGI